MSAPATVRVLHAAGGRIRVHWPQAWAEGEPDVEGLLRAVEGAHAVSANRLTRNILVRFDERVTAGAGVLAALERIAGAGTPGRVPAGGQRPTANVPGAAVPPARLPVLSPLGLEIAERGLRVVGAAAGLALAAMRARRDRERSAEDPAAGVASLVAVVDGFPRLRALSQTVLGPRGHSSVLGLVALVAHTLAGSPLGLAVGGLVALRQLGESLQRRDALRDYARTARPRPPPGAAGRGTIAGGHGDPLLFDGELLDGAGAVLAADGVPRAIAPGARVSAGARLFGGPFTVLVREPLAAGRARRAVNEDDGAFAWLDTVAFAAAGATLALTRSPSRALSVLQLLSRRPSLLGRDAADAGARLRASRAGALPLHPDVVIHRPHVVLLDTPRLLLDGLEPDDCEPDARTPGSDRALALALAVAALAGSPWGPIRADVRLPRDGDGRFDGRMAHAELGGTTYTLAPVDDQAASADGRLRLVLVQDQERLAVIQLRPRISADAVLLAATCARVGAALAVVGGSLPRRGLEQAASAVGVTVVPGARATAVRRAAADGRRVMFVTDTRAHGRAVAPADLVIGIGSELRGPVAASVDVLARDLAAVAAVVDAGERRDAAVRDQIVITLAASLVGAVWAARGEPRHRDAGRLQNAATIVALADTWLRERGGETPRSTLHGLVDPHPERWGRRGVDEVLRAVASRERGLRRGEVEARGRAAPPVAGRARGGAFRVAVLAQLRSPLTAILAGGAGLALSTGAAVDVALISSVIVLNGVLGALQEQRVGAAALGLERLSEPGVTVLREGRRARVTPAEVVPGDVLLLASGDRVTADARVIRARGLEVDESSLTGESLPSRKHVDRGAAESRVVLDGSDVVVGWGRAVAFAVGDGTRLGATAAALGAAPPQGSALERRLQTMLFEIMPVILGAGVLVVVAGIAWRRPLAAQTALGAGTAIAAVPEGLPLLASIGQAAVAQRLAGRRALVRRLGAVESLGRVDVACVDKTGTLTENRLALHVIVAPDGERASASTLSDRLLEVLRSAALASPHPASAAASAHATDVAVIEGARAAGLAGELDQRREREVPFDAVRPYHAALVGGRVYVKGSAEEIVRRCDRVRGGGGDRPLDEAGRAELLERAHALAEEGLRVLIVAEGPPQARVDDPGGLTALGFLGIRDTLRTGVADAVRRCREAGIRLIMLTGDHPETARAIARDVGLLDGPRVLTGPETEQLAEADLAAALEGASVVARIAPLEKLRIVEALQSHGHVIAMTGDGVNDAPALRLADVGVAMGRSGTEVARQASDLVLADDDFGVLVDTLIEGRTFWANLRRALAMLLGGNLGEVVFILGLAAGGVAAPLTARQVLAVNLVSDVLPALSLVVQSPRHDDLGRLAREGHAALGTPLRRDIAVRAAATATPALAAHLAARAVLSPARAQTVGFAAIVLTQLTQTLDASGAASRQTIAAVGGSGSLLVAALELRRLRTLLALSAAGSTGWLLIGAAGLAAPALARALTPSAPPRPRP